QLAFDTNVTISTSREPPARQIREPSSESTSRRNITPSSLDNQFVLRFLSSGIDVELQFTCRPVPVLVGGDKRQIVAAAQVIDERLKGRAELFRFVREYFTAGFVRQIFQVHVP